jgi:hypothetical protein
VVWYVLVYVAILIAFGLSMANKQYHLYFCQEILVETDMVLTRGLPIFSYTKGVQLGLLSNFVDLQCSVIAVAGVEGGS